MCELLAVRCHPKRGRGWEKVGHACDEGSPSPTSTASTSCLYCLCRSGYSALQYNSIRRMSATYRVLCPRWLKTVDAPALVANTASRSLPLVGGACHSMFEGNAYITLSLWYSSSKNPVEDQNGVFSSDRY